MRQGSPLSAVLVSEQLKLGKERSLKECFMFELGMSVQAGKTGEFQEGVRALLIDKDGSPDWQFKSVGDVPSDTISAFTASRWNDDAHPLANM